MVTIQRRAAMGAGLLFAVLVVAGARLFALRSDGSDCFPPVPDLAETLAAAAPEGQEILLPSESASRSSAPAVDGAAVDSPIDSADLVLVLVVEIVDASGAAVAGANVIARTPDGDTFGGERTGADGRTRILISAGDLEGVDVLLVGSSCFATTPPLVEFASREWPTSPLRLVAEPTGSIRITIHDSEPYALDPSAHASLVFDSTRCGGEYSVQPFGPMLDRWLGSREARFERVGLGLCFRAEARSEGLEFESVPFDGPRFPGEVVEVDIPIRDVGLRVSGRLLDGSGAPVRDTWTTVSALPTTDPSFSPQYFFGTRTDETGRFQNLVQHRFRCEDGSRLTFRALPRGSTPRSGSLSWPGLSSASIVDGFPAVDLGDVLLEPVQSVASGRVIDAPGTDPIPWHGAVIDMRSLDEDTETGWFTTDAKIGLDGAFEIGLESVPARFQLRARASSRVPNDPVTVERGAKGVELRLRSGGSADGRLLLAEGVGFDWLELDYACVEPASSPDHHAGSVHTFDDGRFELSSMLPGRYELIVSLMDVELLRHGFEIRPESAILHIEPIDLRKLARRLSFQLAGADGSKIDSGSVYLVSSGETWSCLEADREGHVIACVSTPTIDVIAGSSGFATRRFDAVADGARLVLDRGFPVIVRVPELPPAPTGWKYSVEAWAFDEEPLANASELQVVDLDAQGGAALRLPCAGTFQFYACLRRVGRRDSIPLTSGEVHVDPAAGEPTQPIVLRCDPEAVRRALESSRENLKGQ